MRKLIIWLITWLILSYHAYSQQIIAVDKWKEYVDNLADDAAAVRSWKRFIRNCPICRSIRLI